MNPSRFDIGQFEIPLPSRQQIQALHASKWSGQIEEVGTGGWVQTLLQSEVGASGTLWSSHCRYDREAQHQAYGTATRSIAADTVLAWAQHNHRQVADFFSLALSGSVDSRSQSGDHHAWLCLQFANPVDGLQQRYLLHCRLLAESRQHQQISLGLFVIELLYTLLVQAETGPERLNPAWQDWIEIDVWQALHQSAFENYQSAAKLIKLGWTELVLLVPHNHVLQPVRYLDWLRGQKVLWHKGAFNPVTLAHLEMPKQVLAKQPDLQTVLEISLNNFDKAARAEQDLAHQLAMLTYQPWPIALSRMPAFYRTQEWLRDRAQVEQTQFVCGDDLWQRLLMPQYYDHLEGGVEEGLARLFSHQTQIWVCQRELSGIASKPSQQAPAVYQQQIHFLALHLPVASSKIRRAIRLGQQDWRQDLLPAVADYIQAQQLYQSTETL